MYHDLNATYWWYGMKRDIAMYAALCDTCQCLTSRNKRIRYFRKCMSLLIPFIQEGIRCTMISMPLIGGME
jgi:hypothetical protein